MYIFDTKFSKIHQLTVIKTAVYQKLKLNYNKIFAIKIILLSPVSYCLQYFDAVGWAAGRASGL